MDALLAFVGEVLLAFVGRILIRLVSFDRWDVEAWSSADSTYLAPAGALSFVRDGRRVFTHIGQQFVGFFFIVLLVILGVLFATAV